MLDDFENTINKLQAFDFGLELETIVENNSEKLTEYVREQLAAGIDGDDSPVKIFDRDHYAPRTIEIKQSQGSGLGAVTDHITNYMTGAFYNSLKTDVEGGVFELDSDVSYFGDIRLRSTDSLLEVDDDNKKTFGETVTLPGIQEALLLKTGLKLSVNV